MIKEVVTSRSKLGRARKPARDPVKWTMARPCHNVSPTCTSTVRRSPSAFSCSVAFEIDLWMLLPKRPAEMTNSQGTNFRLATSVSVRLSWCTSAFRFMKSISPRATGHCRRHFGPWMFLIPPPLPPSQRHSLPRSASKVFNFFSNARGMRMAFISAQVEPASATKARMMAMKLELTDHSTASRYRILSQDEKR